AVSPLAGAYGYVGGPVTATFSEPIAIPTISATSFLLTDATGTPIAATVSYDAPSQTATLTPTGPVSATGYVGRVTTAVTDLAGNPMAADDTWSFLGPLPPLPPGTTGFTVFLQTTPDLDGDGSPFPGQANYWDLDGNFCLIDGYDDQFDDALVLD